MVEISENAIKENAEKTVKCAACRASNRATRRRDERFLIWKRKRMFTAALSCHNPIFKVGHTEKILDSSWKKIIGLGCSVK
jgi:hypothetical protein